MWYHRKHIPQTHYHNKTLRNNVSTPIKATSSSTFRQQAIAAVIGSTIVTVSLNPITVLKIRLQAQTLGSTKSLASIVQGIVRNEKYHRDLKSIRTSHMHMHTTPYDILVAYMYFLYSIPECVYVYVLYNYIYIVQLSFMKMTIMYQGSIVSRVYGGFG